MARANAALFPSPRRRIGTRTLGVAALLAVIVILLYVTGTLAKARQMVGLGATAPTYQTSTVSRGNVVVSVTATGPVAAASSLPLDFQSSGKLKDVKVQVGQKVTKGQVLADLDTTELQTAVTQAQASLSQAQANLAKLKAGATSTQKDVAMVAVDNARSAATGASANVQTAQQTSGKSIAAAQASLNTANVGIATAQSNLTAAQDQAKAGLSADQVALTNAQKNLASVQANVVASQPVLQQQLEKAKDDLWAQQISRDATCGSKGGNCNAANAQVASAQTALNTVQAQYNQSQKQNDQQIAQAQAQVDSAQAQLKTDQTKLNASVATAQNALKQAQAQVQSATIGVSQAQAQATATVQSAQQQATTAQGAVKTAENNYNNTVAPSTPQDIAGAQAQVDSTTAALQAAQNNLAAATLVAPFDGTIAAINGTVGQYISGGGGGSSTSATSGFISLVSMNNLQVTSQVNEADISKVKVGDKVTFNVDAYPGKTFSGQVTQIQPVGTTTQNVVNYSVTSSIQSTEGATLYPGMTATVAIVSQEADNVLEVPNTALTFSTTAIRDGLVQFQRPAGQTSGPSGASGQTQRTGTGAATGTTTGQGRAQTGQTGQSGASGQFSRQGNGTSGTGQFAGGFGTSGGNPTRGLIVTMQNGKLSIVPVSLGLTDGSVTEVTGGLTGNETIVTGATGFTTTTSRSTTGQGGTGGQRSPVGGGVPGGAIFVGKGG